MTTNLIPRPQALLKLLALEPITYHHAQIVCGWPAREFANIVRELNERGLVGWKHEDERRTLRLGVCVRTQKRRAAEARAAA